MKKKHEYLILIFPLLFVVMAVGILLAVLKSGIYPDGSDALYHVYRGDYVYRSIQEGNWYPMLAKEWYNGVELLRYWAPLPAYFMAFCQMLALGNVLDGYLVFVGLIFFLGAMAWLWIGWKKDRICMGAFLGVLWFFMPNNLYAMFWEGNLARCVCMIILPLFIHFMEEFFEHRKSCQVIMVSVTFALMALCHLGYAGMIALAVLVYLLIRKLSYGSRSGGRHIIFAMLVGFGVLGVWMLPSLFGGIIGIDTSENLSSFFQSAWTSLNPMERINGDYRHFYFGLAAFIVALVGAFVADKKSRVGFLTALLIFLGTTSSAYYIFELLPGGQFMWMLRFISIALCMILYSLLNWKNLKRGILCVALTILVLDAIPSLPILYGNQSGISAETRLEEAQNTTLIKDALEITEQRVALLDVSSLGAKGAYLITGLDKRCDATFGAGWEAAATSQNIRNINEAFEGGYLLYVFDRCKELGNDTVVVKLDCLPDEEGILENLDQAAELCGYSAVKEQSGYKLFHLDGVSGNWGVKSKYKVIAIGNDSFRIAVQFPAIEEGRSANLDDYTFEELLEYETIYLGTFTYNERETAEDLIRRLSEAGVKIVISADGIPEDNKSHSQSFLGVRCEKITFQNGYPELIIYDELINPDLFPAGSTNWETVYTEGLDKVEGYLMENDLMIPFMGTVENDNIHVVGLGISQFCSITKDKTVTAALGKVMEQDSELLPERELIPLQIEYEANSIRIVSPEDDVNTTIAYHTIFESEQELQNVNNLLVVQSGTTEINMVCKEMLYGLGLSLFSVVLMVVYVVERRKRKGILDMKILVTGVNGQLGHDVMNELAKRGMKGIGADITPEYSGAADGTAVCKMLYVAMDITDKEAVYSVLEELKPDAVIHCAAWTAVDMAEDDDKAEQVRAVNATGTKYIAECCKQLGSKMMYISTDYVFDGQGEAPWEPDCKDYQPLNVYGQTKLEGEQAVSGLLDKYFIVRIAWVFGANGKNFIKTMIQLGQKYDSLRVVCDQIGTPTYTFDLARLLVDMIVTDKYGYYHATNEGGYISWYEFACAIFKEAGMETEVIPVTTEEYGVSKAARPFNSRLDKRKLLQAGFEPLPTWQDALHRYVELLRQEKFF